MKLKKAVLLIVPIITLVLEALPIGVVLKFGGPDGEVWLNTYSYFDLTPYGYANVGPLFTAVLTCLLLAVAIFGLIKLNKITLYIVRIVSAVSIITSFMPHIFGFEYISVVGVIITLLLITEFAVTFLRTKE